MTLQRIESPTQRDTDRDQVRDEAKQFESPWFTSHEACEYLRYTSKSRLISLYRFMRKKGIKSARRDGRLLIARRDLERAIAARRTR